MWSKDKYGERKNPKPVIPAVRRICLKCRLPFMSQGFRICPKCTEENTRAGKRIGRGGRRGTHGRNSTAE